ncbi:hypothetical protein DNL40_04020 [Xylanimonas oleitrophica]|uniref:PilZ domain-containing protein n=1 Tax=Xylanimonas oleitrophica TaxID=2607479 RepID=A0A2W5Y725_9MICO|nr:PilZ domain-containing protein [Xylanimonas oleitrophica]PZR54114.1 hypothetical protein DNL40_04020 [Xylanimonas oleitrophica]
MHESRPCVAHVDGDDVDARVVFFEDDVMRIELTAPDGGPVVVHLPDDLPPGLPVRVDVLDDVRGECVYDAYLRGRDDLVLELGDVTEVSRNQKRNFVRVDLHLELEAQVVAPPVQGKPGETGTYKVTIQDLSAHGLRLTCRKTLPQDSEVRLTLPGVVRVGKERTDLPVRARIVRIQQSGGVAHYGCRFIGTDRQREDRLSRYLAEVQREQRRLRIEQA